MLRAAPERRLEIGSETNAQDNIIVRALNQSASIGNETSLAHHAIVRDSTISDFAFVGFDAEVVNSTVERGALISAKALIQDVTLPENALVPPGAQITTQEQADALESVTEENDEFKREVLDVNVEFAENYITLFEEEGYDAVIGVGPNPVTSFNSERVEPQIGDTEVGEFVRIIGDVSIGSGSEVGERAAIHADEGSPINIGSGAKIEERVTFHALKGTRIDVGDDLTVGDDSTIHGPIEIGNNLTVGDDSVVFRVRVGNNVTVGDDVVIQGSANEDGELELEIPDGATIPDGSVVTSQEELDDIIGQQGRQQGQGKEKENGEERNTATVMLGPPFLAFPRCSRGHNVPLKYARSRGGLKDEDSSDVGHPRGVGPLQARAPLVGDRGDEFIGARPRSCRWGPDDGGLPVGVRGG